MHKAILTSGAAVVLLHSGISFAQPADDKPAMRPTPAPPPATAPAAAS